MQSQWYIFLLAHLLCFIRYIRLQLRQSLFNELLIFNTVNFFEHFKKPTCPIICSNTKLKEYLVKRYTKHQKQINRHSTTRQTQTDQETLRDHLIFFIKMLLYKKISFLVATHPKKG